MTRRARIALIGAGIVVLLLALSLRMILQPERFTRTVIDRAGKALGLEITASGGEYRLRGTPQLVVRDVVVREPGATTPMLLAERALLSLPWSTIRSQIGARGDVLDATRIELDAPRLDVPALQHWLATRPKRETRIPTLTEGLRITRGRIDNNDASGKGWRIDGIDVQLPSLVPGKPVNSRIKGRYVDPPNTVRFDVAISMTRPENGAGLAMIGPVTVERAQWRIPGYIRLSGPLHVGKDDVRLSPARLGMSARFMSTNSGSGDTDLPFVLGLHGSLLFDEGTWALAPAGLVLRGSGEDSLLPDLQARGALALGRRLVVQLQGRIAAWPQAWPSLPPPIGQSTSPLPVALDYVGKPDLSGIARLQLQRDATRFNGRFRAFEVAAWVAEQGSGSPLPPLDGTISTPRVEIAGAQLEGIEIVFDEPTLDESTLDGRALDGLPAMESTP